MALINCPECNREVSDKAEVCLHCGFGVAKYVERQNKIVKIQEEAEKEAYLYVKQKKKEEKEAAERKKRAEEDRKNSIYDEAVDKYTSEISKDVKKAEELFSTILGWKDSDTYLIKCKDRISELRQREALREEKCKKRKIIFAIVIMGICIGFIIGGYSLYRMVIVPRNVYESAMHSIQSEDYEGSAGTDAKSEGVMTYAEYVAADLDTEVVIETYVQAKQSWWDNKATVYTQDKDGAYFLYNMVCSEEDYAKLTPGTKIKATGYKTEWSGEVEIADATFEIEDGNYVAAAEDVTSLLGSDDLIDHQNKFVSFKGMTVEAAGQDADGNDVAFLYSWDGSGQDGDDLYFNVSLDGAIYTFTVESYLCDNTTEVYNAVKDLNIGDTVDMEGFLYWYEGVNPHITSVIVK